MTSAAGAAAAAVWQRVAERVRRTGTRVTAEQILAALEADRR